MKSNDTKLNNENMGTSNDSSLKRRAKRFFSKAKIIMKIMFLVKKLIITINQKNGKSIWRFIWKLELEAKVEGFD